MSASKTSEGVFAEVSLMTHPGLVRDSNEDNCCYSGWHLPETHASMQKPARIQIGANESMLAGVFDGIGGEWFGEVASYAAAKVFAYAEICDSAELNELFIVANEAVCREKAARKTATMGTTAVVFWISNMVVLFGNVGDSKGYLFRDGQLIEMTTSDTNEKLLEAMGLHDAKPSITQYLGVDGPGHLPDPHIYSLQPQPGDLLLIASDGLTDELTASQIADILDEPNQVDQIARSLCDAALANGGHDNVTLAVGRINDNG